jgi:plastocyanin
MKRILSVAFVLATALVAVAVALGATTLSITSDKSGKLAFSKKALTAKPGKVTIKMLNVQVLLHNVAIKKTKSAKKPIVKGQVVGKGKTSKVTASLKAGSYIFYCTVPGHEAAGMWGVLKVK